MEGRWGTGGGEKWRSRPGARPQRQYEEPRVVNIARLPVRETSDGPAIPVPSRQPTGGTSDGPIVPAPSRLRTGETSDGPAVPAPSRLPSGETSDGPDVPDPRRQPNGRNLQHDEEGRPARFLHTTTLMILVICVSLTAIATCAIIMMSTNNTNGSKESQTVLDALRLLLAEVYSQTQNDSNKAAEPQPGRNLFDTLVAVRTTPASPTTVSSFRRDYNNRNGEKFPEKKTDHHVFKLGPKAAREVPFPSKNDPTKALSLEETDKDAELETQTNHSTRCRQAVTAKETTPRDCDDLHKMRIRETGIYMDLLTQPLRCVMTSDAGWTVIQRRTDGSEDFYRNWEDYKTGFGDPAGEFWLGNELLYQITASKCHRLRIRLEDWEGNVAFAEYDFFAVEGESDGYRLRLGAYSGGTAGDGMRKNADNRFTTKDRDNDVWGHHSANNCAKLRDGGWWYAACGSSNLNGVYRQFRDAEPVIIDIRYNNAIWWRTWKKTYQLYPLKSTEMSMAPYIGEASKESNTNTA